MVLSVVRDLESIIDTPITLKIGCDNQRSLNVVNEETTKKKNADFEHEIQFLSNKLRGGSDVYHIKIHQDMDQEYDSLPSEVQAQIRLHNREKDVISRRYQPHYELLPIPLTHQTVFFSSSQGVITYHPYYFLNY